MKETAQLAVKEEPMAMPMIDPRIRKYFYLLLNFVQFRLQNENGPISQRDRRNRDRKTPMEERGTPTRNNHDSDAEMEEDVDVKKMKVNFDETTQIMEVVKEFELDYASSK